MEDLTTEGTAEDVAVPEIAAETTGPEENGGFNPAWEPIKEKLGDAHFQLIQSELSKWDQGVNKRFETINSQFAPYKDLGTPEEIAGYKQIVQQMEANPEAMYDALGQFLKETGRMPTQEEAQDIADDLDDEAAGTEDPRLAELAKGQEEIRNFLEQQRVAEIQANADAELANEIEELTNARGYSKEDMKEIVSRAAFLSSNSNKVIPLSQAADEFDALRERILTTPRPGDSAPRLLPTSGGTASNNQTKSMGELSRNETQDLVAAVLAQGSKS
jgi:predicted house-cleaning noncanonical NTP pyrophosphatase (MazG superfamily)